MARKLGFGFVDHFARRRPVWTPRIKRIEDEVAPVRIEELRCVLERWIVDDCRLSTLRNLGEDASLQNTLSGTRVTHDHDVTTLQGARDR